MTIKNKIYITTSIFLLSSLFLVLFFIYPLISEIVVKSNDIKSLKKDLFIIDKQFEEAKNFDKNYYDYELNFEKIDHLFVDAKNPVNFIEFLEKSAQSSLVSLQISSPSIEADKSAGFQLSLYGGFQQTLAFLKKIESGPYLVEIQSLSMSSKTSENKIKTELSVRALTK